MLGAIIGDIVGSRFEFNNHRSKEFELFTDECFVTDDSIMTLAVAKALMETEYFVEPDIRLSEHEHKYLGLLNDNTIRFMRGIGRRYPCCGYGGMFRRWVLGDDPKPYGSYGNGAAMRISPVGYVARTHDQVQLLSGVITSVTHDHMEGLKGAEAVAMAVYMARRGYLKSEIYNKINEEYYPIDFTIDAIRNEYSFDETCQKTVPQAIRCFIESEGFEDAIRIAVSLGGDSDTIAAITGSIAEAYYGIPEDMKDRALSYLDEELLAIYNEWEAFIGEEEYVFKLLTKYIPYIMDGDDIKHEFIREMYFFAGMNPEYEMFSYRDVLAQNGFDPDKLNIDDVKLTDLDKKGTLALLQYIVRSEHFVEGSFSEYIKTGIVTELLMHLHGLDSAGKERKLAEVMLFDDLSENYFHYHFIVSDKKIINHSNEWFRTLSINESKKFLADWKNLQTEYWNPRELPPENYRRLTKWLLYARYEGDRGSIYMGYKENRDRWSKLTDLVGLQENIELKKKRKPGDLILCSVVFEDGEKRYHYLTEDESISKWDEVIVPVGSENRGELATVEEVGYCSPDDLPYPLEKLKYIIRECFEKKSTPAGQSSITLYGSSGENGSTVVWARIEDGCLEIEQQDLGPYIPSGEHEIFYSFDSETTKAFSELITGRTDDLDFFLKRFAKKFKGPYWDDELRYFCKHNGLKYTMFGC